MIVDQVIVWMQSASAADRCRAAELLARSFLVSELDDDDREGLEAALTVLLDDPEPEIRRVLAETLCDSDRVPHHLILTLAEGRSDIAAIVLNRSPVLMEAELVDFVASGDEIVQTAIASRQWLSPAPAAALAEVGTLAAAVVLAGNVTASVPPFSLARLAERLGHEAALREALFARAHLPADVRQTLMRQVAGALANLVVERDWLSADRSAEATAEAADKATAIMAASVGAEERPAFAEFLRRTGQLTTTLLLRAVTFGDIHFLGEALALLSGMPRVRVEALLAEGREASCRALFLKAGIPERTFPAFAAALEVQRELAAEVGFAGGDEYRFGRRAIERALSRCRQAGTADLDDLMVLLRRFATEAARDQARVLVSKLMRRQPLALPPPARGDDVAAAA
ncbi:MAG: DUF2336 domain-containing protein [Ancalomicrobiaceae bacterium]|nr:DUF2336 domain-containing protein [Ancalomicrobiaceae bacterium]